MIELSAPGALPDREKELLDHLEWAWTGIANAGGGDWSKESNDWQEWAANWRDKYHEILLVHFSRFGNTK